MFRNKFSITQFSLILSVLTFLFFHFSFFRFVFENINYKSYDGILLIVSLVITILVANAFVFYLFFLISLRLGKILLISLFIINAIACYFVNTYHIIIDESMIGNVFNTNYEESTAFFSFKLILYLFFLGFLPSLFIFKIKITRDSLKRTLLSLVGSLLFLVLIPFVNASNWLWIDKHSKQLGGLVMPWSYVINTIRFHIHKSQENQKEIPLPAITFKNHEKSVVVLVIGESARRSNFSLYGYQKNTNPLLTQTENIHIFNANSCATYTTAGVRCIVTYKNTSDLYEILPNYLYHNNVDVSWRTTNWGEPPVHIAEYLKAEDLRKNCKEGDNCNYDGILVSGLKERILASNKNKILIILHTSTSHGPTYNKKYPSEFEIFKPVCNSVELGECTSQELINAYDNTIVYTDYLLHNIISQLKELPDFKSCMIYVSDHGESLGEKNLYMHGMPMSLAPKEQYEIPFIVWTSSNAKKLKNKKEDISQNYVFHSVMNFLGLTSSIYEEDMNLFQEN